VATALGTALEQLKDLDESWLLRESVVVDILLSILQPSFPDFVEWKVVSKCSAKDLAGVFHGTPNDL
jgi:hypothetical protein